MLQTEHDIYELCPVIESVSPQKFSGMVKAWRNTNHISQATLGRSLGRSGRMDLFDRTRNDAPPVGQHLCKSMSSDGVFCF